MIEIIDRPTLENHIESYELMTMALRNVITWASSRCPCKGGKPDPCPLCGAYVDKDICLSAEYTLPSVLLVSIRKALASYNIKE